MTRTVCIGKPTEEMIRVYATVQRAQAAALDAFSLGKTGEELDAVARTVIYNAGYEGCFGHGLGHGVGMDIHEAPRLKAGHTIPMDVGMVVTCEPGVYLEGKYGVRIEDMVVFTESGPMNITRSPKQLIVID
jgi:Xaa-Pro aminopeptidase